MSLGNPGVVQPSVEGLFELRIDCDPGYCVCCFLHSSILVVLLFIGDKRTQQRDIERTKKLAAEWKVDVG